MNTEPLRLILFLDSLAQPLWVERMLQEAVEAGVAVIAGVVLDDKAGGGSNDGRRQPSPLSAPGAIPYALFRMYDRPSLAHEPDPFAPGDISALVKDSVILSPPQAGAAGDTAGNDVLQAVRGVQPDVGLDLGVQRPHESVLDVAPHGVWFFEHGGYRPHGWEAAGFREVVKRVPTTVALLRRHSTRAHAGDVVYRTCIPTDSISPKRNRARLYWAAARGLRIALRHALAGLPESQAIDAQSAAERDDATRRVSAHAHRHATPRAVQATSGALALLSRRVRGRLRRRAEPEWRVAWRFDAHRSDADAPELSPQRLHIMTGPRGSVQADPFVVPHGADHLVFYEEIPVGGSLGRIAYVRIGEHGVVGAPTVVLERPHHLSYPTLFQWQGEWYLVPECFTSNCQEVYRATSFPDAWTLHDRWFDGDPIVDPSIFEHDGRWWLLTSRPVPPTLVGDELFAFHAPTPLGPWTPHSQNPIRSGVDGSRPAGMPFRMNGALVRPAQVGAPHYGAAVRLWEIERLTPEQYTERELGLIQPTWSRDVIGFHTINSAGRLTVGDLLIRPEALDDPASAPQ